MTVSSSSPFDTIDPAVLSQVVRLDQNSPDFVLADWKVRPLSVKGLANREGLLLVSGFGQDSHGAKSWKVVLKKPSLKPPILNSQPGHLFNWKRELDLSQSGLFERLPGPVATPRCYHTAEWQDCAHVWLEFIHDTSQPRWTLDQYRFAARQLGRMSWACLKANFFSDDSWLCHQHVRHYLDLAPILCRREGTWSFDARVKKAFTSATIEKTIRLLEENEPLIQILEQLPQVFSHFDFNRRNLLIRQVADGGDELVALDWAYAGIGALGGELVSLIGSSTLLYEYEPADLPVLEAAAYPEYLAGLREAGWDGNAQQVRLAYTAWLALWLGAMAPVFANLYGAENGPGITLFDCQPEEMIAGWAVMCEYALDRGEEARRLIQRLF